MTVQDFTLNNRLIKAEQMEMKGNNFFGYKLKIIAQ